MASEREESGELVPSEAQFLVKSVSTSLVATDITTREGHSEHLGAKDASKTKVQGIPTSFIVGVSLSGSILACACKATSGENEWTLVIVLLGAILCCLHHTVSIEGVNVVLLYIHAIHVVSSVQ